MAYMKRDFPEISYKKDSALIMENLVLVNELIFTYVVLHLSNAYMIIKKVIALIMI